MGRILRIKQQDIYDCGAACLCAISAWYGVRPSLAKARRACGCSQEGITIKGIIEGAASLGLTGKGYKSPDKDITPLVNLQAPVIAHIKTKEEMYHFVVISKVTRNHITIMDPAFAEFRKLTYSEFHEMWCGYIIVFSKSDNSKRQNLQRNRTAANLFKILIQHKKEAILAAIGSIALVIIGLSNSLFLQQLIDKAIPAKNIALLTFISIIIFVLLAMSSYIGYARTMYLIRNSIRIDAQLILSYVRKVFKLPADFFAQYSCGDINSRIEDAFKIRAFISDGLISVFISIITFAATTLIMFIYYGKLALFVSLSIPCYVILYYIANKINKKYNKELAITGAKFESSVIDSIHNIMEIKHFSAEDIATEKIEDKYIDMSDKILSASKAVNILGTSVETLSKGLLAIILIIGGTAVFNSKLTIGELVSFYTLCAFFTSPLNSLININNTITQAIVSSERLFEIMELDEEESSIVKTNIQGYRKLLSAPENIEITNLSFSYIGREPLFKNLNTIIHRGKITAFSGENGCGKSTLAALLLRDYSPANGTISINSLDISSIPIKEWRKYITIIPQKCCLFNGTILENITSGDENPDIEKVVRLCVSLGIDDLIKKLPMGLFYNAGDGGALFSGGELQKISTARALYRNPEIIIFDEATSSLDEQSEKFMLEKMIELRNSGKSVIMITHKKSNLTYADNIIDLNQISNVYTKVEFCAPSLQEK